MVRDSTTLQTSTSALTETTTEWFIKSEEKTVAVATGKIQWSFRVTGAGNDGCCDVLLRVDGTEIVAHVAVVVGPENKWLYPAKKIAFEEPCEITITSIDPVRIGNTNGFIRCEVDFVPFSLPVMPQISFKELCSYLFLQKPDASLSVGDRTIPLHRGIFSLLSPALCSKFIQNHNVVITDFEYSVVKDTIDLCYGHAIGEKPFRHVMSMYNFSEKYAIGIANKKIEQFIETNFFAPRFCSVAKYAWTNETKGLQNKCAEYFRKNVSSIIFLPEFMSLGADIKDKIICASANL